MAKDWTIALFAGLAERLGTRSLRFSWEHDSLTAGQLKQLIADRYPEHAELLAVCFVARNQAFANDEATVAPSDELALLPPVSGGSDSGTDITDQAVGGARYWITDQPLDANLALSKVYHPDHGAAIAFVGTTREWTQGKKTVTLEYEAYVPMAESSLALIGDEISARWTGTLCSIGHRIGTVGIGEISVVIAVSSAHRADAYEASRYAIERLKQVVPIWKKEVYEDGTEWKGNQTGPWDPTASPDRLATGKE